MAAVRGLPWLGRNVRTLSRNREVYALGRTVLWSLLGVLAFGALFASADALFAEWFDRIMPDLSIDGLADSAFVAAGITGAVFGATYLGLNPPRLDRQSEDRPALPNRYEWLVPVLLVDAVFLAYLVAQATAFFGGQEYLERTTGLTYAEYVHQGFGQLTVATALTLLVVWAAQRRASREHHADRVWLRVSLGTLCTLTLVVVASALSRMNTYQEAYGFTALRVLVDVFEGWLGLVVLAVLVAGVRLRGWWLPRFALLGGAAMLLGLVLVNPDGWIAEQNLDRYAATGQLDVDYLAGLSADAAPTLAALPAELHACVLAGPERPSDGFLGWNLGRARAYDLTGDLPARDVSCPSHIE